MGAGNTVASHVAHTMKSSEKLIRDMYHMFFTPDEIDKMLSGSDYYMDKDEFIERCERRSVLAQEAQMEAEEAAKAEKPAKKPLKLPAKKSVASK